MTKRKGKMNIESKALRILIFEIISVHQVNMKTCFHITLKNQTFFGI